MSEIIILDIQMQKLKIVSSVKLKTEKSKVFVDYDMYVDTGSSDTVISEQLFNELGYKEQEKIPATIIGINGKSKGFSTIINDFIIGGVNLGKTRVTIAKLEAEFANVVILGMNVLAWFNMLVSYSKKEITLAERKIKNIDKSTRFNRVDIFQRISLQAKY